MQKQSSNYSNTWLITNMYVLLQSISLMSSIRKIHCSIDWNMHTEAWIWNCCLFTCSRINTDVAHPPKIRTSPGEVVQQAVCHIRVMGLLKPKVSKCHSSLWKTLVPMVLLYLVTSHKLLSPWPKSEKQGGKRTQRGPCLSS